MDGAKYTRYCSIKYLEQHLGSDEFVRLSPSVIVPFRHIASCKGKEVVMRMFPWMEKPLTFRLDTPDIVETAETICAHLPADQEKTGEQGQEDGQSHAGRATSVPPEKKIDDVFRYIRRHTGCRSKEITLHTSFSLSTVERCLSELRRRGLIEYEGSKKSGGYRAVTTKRHASKKSAGGEGI